MKHIIFLIPGFFGFERLGGIEYFRHVRNILVKDFIDAGHEVTIVTVPTHPTASLRKRARTLAESMKSSNVESYDKVHVMGHSTGGLDARLLVTPGVSLGRDADRFEAEVDTVVTLATPHHGTPIAAFFTHLAGKHLLMGLSLFMVISMHGAPGLSYTWAGKLLGLVTRLDDVLGFDNTLLDYMSERLLRDFTPERRREVRAFMREISREQGALLQLTPEAMDIYNAAVVDRPGVRYLSYITAAPRFKAGVAKKFRNPYFAASYSMFLSLYSIARRYSPKHPYPDFPRELEGLAERVFGFVPGNADNDGVVPTNSQRAGKAAGLVLADHLDVCGHFDYNMHGVRHTDWLASNAGFSRPDFEALYDDMASRLMEERIPRRETPNFEPL